MTKRPSTLIMTKSDPDYVVTDEMRDLVVQYMNAVNQGDHAEAENLLHMIRQENIKNGSDN